MNKETLKTAVIISNIYEMFIIYTRLDARSFLSHDNTLAYTGVTETPRGSGPCPRSFSHWSLGPALLRFCWVRFQYKRNFGCILLVACGYGDDVPSAHINIFTF